MVLIILLITLSIAYCEEKQELKWVQIWPSEAPVESSTNSKGKEFPATGPGAFDWFNYGGAGDWKVFNVIPNQPIYIKARGDVCPGCFLGHLKFNIIEEDEDEEEIDSFEFDGPEWSGAKPENEIGFRLIYYVPKSKRLKIISTGGGFYVTVYQLKKCKIKEKVEEKEIISLIKDITNENHRVRKKARKELIKIGNQAVPFLEKVLTDIKDIIEEIKENSIGEPIQEETLDNNLKELIDSLFDNLEDNEFDMDSEAFESLALLGPRSIRFIISKTDHEETEARLAVIELIKDTKSMVVVKCLIKLLKDKNKEVKDLSYKVLKKLTGETIPSTDLKQWEEWWKNNKNKWRGK